MSLLHLFVKLTTSFKEAGYMRMPLVVLSLHRGEGQGEGWDFPNSYLSF